jgi:hypothetical protein
LQEDIDVNKAAKPPAYTFRIMGSGSCTHYFAAGKYKALCPCLHGMFNIHSETPVSGNEECLECTHPLSEHKDESSDSTQNILAGEFSLASRA